MGLRVEVHDLDGDLLAVREALRREHGGAAAFADERFDTIAADHDAGADRGVASFDTVAGVSPGGRSGRGRRRSRSCHSSGAC
jgi:hypothetical protein